MAVLLSLVALLWLAVAAFIVRGGGGRRFGGEARQVAAPEKYSAERPCQDPELREAAPEVNEDGSLSAA